MKTYSRITTGSLIRDMVNMWKLAETPDPFYKTIQFSSYDRCSSLPGGKGWFDNADGFGGEKIPNYEKVIKEADKDGFGEYLVCELNGPGAMVRSWTAKHKGTIQVFLDNSEVPLYDGPAESFFKNPYHSFALENGIDEKEFDNTLYQRYAGYCPIPFEKSCKVIWKGDIKDVHFYHLQFRIYDEGTSVTTFKSSDLKTYYEDIIEVGEIMRNPDQNWIYKSSNVTQNFKTSIQAGEYKDGIVLKGPGAIEKLSLLLNAKNIDKALRQTVLHVICEEAPWGQIQSPVGDFFGAAPGINPYVSLPFSVLSNGEMISRFIMPYEKEIKIGFENLGDQTVEIEGKILNAEYEWDYEKSMHFRAKWRVTHDMVGSVAVNQDMPYLIANGAGTYVGSAMFLLNSCNVPSGWGSWWGEGDEKVFVDEDTFPSIFGTGSEDYFNYAWGQPDIFEYPYFAQPRNDGPVNRGFVTNNRWHILDPMPFKFRLSFYMEFWPHEPTKGTAYARIGYHYGKPGMMDDHVVVTRDDVRHQQLPENWLPEATCGCKGSVFYSVDKLVKNKTNTTIEKNNLWSERKLLRWHPKQKGDMLKITFPIEENGKYNIAFCMAMDKNSGTVSIKINGENHKWGGHIEKLSLCTSDRILSRMFGTALELSKGEHTVSLTFEGETGKTIGLDFLQVQNQAKITSPG